MSGGFLAIVAAIVAAAAWYWDSPWPVALGAAYVAIVALDMARGAARHSALAWSLAHPARPKQMRWSFSVILTERAWDTMGVPTEKRAVFQKILGEYEGIKRYLFKGSPAPAWISRPITVSYERWGESLERWTIWNSWVSELLEPATHHQKRVLESLPTLDETETVILWGEWEGPHFRFEDGRLLFLNRDENTSVMPDGKLYVKDESRVLFNIPSPTLSMSRGEWRRESEPNPLDRFATPDDPPGDGFGPFYYRRPGRERFECETWDKGFRWDLEVNDLRPCLFGRITRVRRSLWRRQVKWLRVELDDTGVRLAVNPLVVEPTSEGRTLPTEGRARPDRLK